MTTKNTTNTKDEASNVFLGGTCAGSNWRNRLIGMLDKSYFNPVVDDWTPECQAEEIRQREISNYCLYVLTPNLEGFFSIAEVIDDSNKRPEKTIFCVLEQDVKNGEGTAFNKKQMKSLNAVGEMVVRNGGHWLKSLQEVAQFLNK